MDFRQGDNDECLLPIFVITGFLVKDHNVDVYRARGEFVRASLASEAGFDGEEGPCFEFSLFEGRNQ